MYDFGQFVRDIAIIDKLGTGESMSVFKNLLISQCAEEFKEWRLAKFTSEKALTNHFKWIKKYLKKQSESRKNIWNTIFLKSI